MLVSCLCPTFNRAPGLLWLVEEAIESFLRQDYPDKELIVLNDTPGQELLCDAPGVLVVNSPGRFATLGEKRNALCLLARGDVFCVWDDDDVSLPWRISQSVERLGGCGYWNPQRSWWLNHGELHSDHSHGYCHNASAFTRRAWAAAGGYPAVSGDEDAQMDGLLRRVAAVGPPLSDDPARWSYVYRWGVSPTHLSGVAPHQAHYDELARRRIVRGTFGLQPAWRRDYVALTRGHVPAGSSVPEKGRAG